MCCTLSPCRTPLISILLQFVNNKAYEFIVHKDNKKQYNGCYGDDSIRRMCGGNERVNSVIQVGILKSESCVVNLKKNLNHKSLC